MIRNNKWKMAVSSVIILLPILAGMILWNDLPEQVATHWDFEGNANGWSSRGMAVFGLPLMLLAVQWLCVFVTARDPGNRDRNHKAMNLVLWIVPLVSIFGSAATYLKAMDIECDLGRGVFGLLGVLFIAIGNYLPKCSQNRTIGIKIPWTLASEANWNATHRLAGRLWVIGGAVMLLGIFLPAAAQPWLLGITSALMFVVPVVYSYLFCRRHG